MEKLECGEGERGIEREIIKGENISLAIDEDDSKAFIQE